MIRFEVTGDVIDELGDHWGRPYKIKLQISRDSKAMKTKTTLPVTEARKEIFSLVKAVQKEAPYYTLTERGRPRAVLLSADRFEALTESRAIQENSSFYSSAKKGLSSQLASDFQGYPQLKKGFWDQLLVLQPVLRERIRRYSWEEETSEYSELKELVRAQLYVQLIDRQKFPLKMVKLGQYVQVGPTSSKRYIEADILILNKERQFGLVFAVEPLEQFEENLELRMGEMFDLAEKFQASGTPLKKLVYFSRGFCGDFLKEKVRVINAEKYPSFKKWKEAGEPTGKRLPRYGKGK